MVFPLLIQVHTGMIPPPTEQSHSFKNDFQSSMSADASNDCVSNSSPAPLLSVRNVCKTYLDGDVHALRNICMQIQPGEFVSIMGPSGCGKSTLLHLLGALDRPTGGEILFEGESLGNIKNLDALRAQRIGFVFQSFYLLPNLTALENVQLPMFEGKLPIAKRTHAAERLLTMVGLADRLQHLPNQLSIGQRQRVAIARALANEPSIVLADEPTGSLDSHSGREVMELLSEMHTRQAATLVVVTHDPQVAAYGQRLIRLLDGEILSDEKTP
jgi:putative ABC transport system ATP-binding protein